MPSSFENGDIYGQIGASGTTGDIYNNDYSTTNKTQNITVVIENYASSNCPIICNGICSCFNASCNGINATLKIGCNIANRTDSIDLSGMIGQLLSWLAPLFRAFAKIVQGVFGIVLDVINTVLGAVGTEYICDNFNNHLQCAVY